MEILNYTGSPISVKLDYEGGEKILYPVSNAQLASPPKEKLIRTIDNIPIYTSLRGGVINLTLAQYWLKM